MNEDKDEGSAAIFARYVRETPDVAKTNRGTGGSHDETESAAPLFTFFRHKNHSFEIWPKGLDSGPVPYTISILKAQVCENLNIASFTHEKPKFLKRIVFLQCFSHV